VLGHVLAPLAPRIPLALFAGARDNISKDAVESVRRMVERTRLNRVELFPSPLHGFKLLRLEPKLTAAIGVDPADLLRPSSAPLSASPAPGRALSLPEARLLRRALHGQVPMAARGIAGAATAHLLATGVLIASREDPTRATTITVADDVTDALSAHPLVTTTTAKT